MAKKYSVLILPWQETRIRRFAFSKRVIHLLLACGVISLGISGWMFGKYFWTMHQMKLKRIEVSTLRGEAEEQMQRLSLLENKSKEIHTLLGQWKGFYGKIHVSLPKRHQSSNNGLEVMEKLERRLALLQGELERLIASAPSAWPVRGYISSRFGRRLSPFDGNPEIHTGIDIPKAWGTPIRAAGHGTVKFAGRANGYGRTVVLNHGQRITTRYSHMSKIEVKKGQKIRRGEPIGKVGNTGESTNPHLHYEIRVNGIPIDPRRVLVRNNSSSS